MKPRKNKQRTYARNRFLSRRGNPKYSESDGRFILKLAIVIILGSLWVKFHNAGQIGGPWIIGLPIGLVIGLFLIYKFEQSPFNRRVWYAIIVLVTIISVFLPAGIMI